MSYYVYAHLDEEGQYRYIGKGSKKRAFDFYRRNDGWKSVFPKGKLPKVIFLSRDIEDEQIAYDIEDFFIKKYRDLGHDLKTKARGESHRKAGFRHTEETRRKISEANKGTPGFWKGKTRGPHSEEWRNKISESNKGKVQSQETRDKISASKKGKGNQREGIKHSTETKNKMSTKRAVAWSNGTYAKSAIKRQKRVRCIELDKSFNSVKEAVAFINGSSTRLTDCLKGRTKKYHGYTWEYL